MPNLPMEVIAEAFRRKEIKKQIRQAGPSARKPAAKKIRKRVRKTESSAAAAPQTRRTIKRVKNKDGGYTFTNVY